MAISNYAELQAAAANWLVRGDLTARVPEFIALAEARLNRVLRMRLAETELAFTVAAGGRSVPLPIVFAEPLGLWIEDAEGRRPLRFVEPSLLGLISLRGEPAVWSIDGPNLVLERPCNQACNFVLRMLAKFQLSNASPTNTLLTDCPDAYLFATLCEAAPFLRDPELAASYEGRLGRAIAEINDKEARSRSGSTLVTEVATLVGPETRAIA